MIRALSRLILRWLLAAMDRPWAIALLALAVIGLDLWMTRK